jgi:hypothetical protein
LVDAANQGKSKTRDKIKRFECAFRAAHSLLDQSVHRRDQSAGGHAGPSSQ